MIIGVWATTPFTQGEFYVLFPATLAGVLGILDDLVDLRPWAKLTGQAGAALILLLLLPPPILAYSATGSERMRKDTFIYSGLQGP